jgi:hypothetical protein
MKSIKIKKYLAITSVILMLNSCIKKVEIDIPYPGDKIVLFSYIKHDSTIYAKVTKTYRPGAPYTTSPSVLNSNANLKLLENGLEVASFSKLYNYTTESYTSNYKAKPNKTYTIKATAANLPDAYGVETMVNKPNYKVDSFYYVPAVAGTSSSKSHNYIKLNLTDNANEENFYFLKIFRADTNTSTIGPRYKIDEYNPYYYYVNSIVDNESIFDFLEPISYEKLFFTDTKFNGKNLSIKLDIQGYNNIPRIAIVLSAISKSYYRYYISSENQQNNSGNPFAEPSQVYTNITNGYGLVATTADSVFFRRK